MEASFAAIFFSRARSSGVRIGVRVFSAPAMPLASKPITPCLSAWV